MFAFKLWGKFGAFRDPMTITQHISLIAPPKTAMGGILAAIIGLDYNELFNDEVYFDFKYSLVLPTEILKKSFTQNYIEDYTKKSKMKLKILNDLFHMAPDEDKTEIFEKLDKKMIKPKPVFRELLLNPEYFVFIKNYKYEDRIVHLMKEHSSFYSLYMGNTEFAANYEFLSLEVIRIESDIIHSFTTQNDRILFEEGKKYTKMYSATRTVNDREYRDYRNILFCNEYIKLEKEIELDNIKIKYGKFNCEFI